ncbi:MAG: GGDEF domain-containing response regulator [Solidesulfovibrio sp. DCME]|uniref:GGDEF domain-containing response regulator n=1 Tax=Solidesulfovibrio sp. DCME TaxID=3447380 RepID=UPI003D0BBA0B
MCQPQPPPLPRRVLLVEDSTLFGRLLKGKLEQELGVETVWLKTFGECLERLDSGDTAFDAALLDLTLPDAPHGEIIDLVLSHGIPGIVFTGNVSDAQREAFWTKRIVDYILKQSECGLDLAVRQVKRIIANRDMGCLVVDDSKLYRKSIANLLRAHGYHVLEAASGREALAILQAQRDIKLVLVDYAMPEMDGVELTREIRRISRIDEQAVIGLSNSDDKSTPIRFLKNGANDYIKKPFEVEEFYCRVSLNIDMLSQFATIKELAYTDPLSGTANRRALFAAGQAALAQARQSHVPLTVAMIDIDRFKHVNDTFGHEAGDDVIRHLGACLRAHFPQDEHHIGRIGGEEFCVASPGRTVAQLLPAYEAFRRHVEDAVVATRGRCVGYTVSVGVSDAAEASFEDLLKEADTRLYRAKTAGRNRVIATPAP